jgi:hypothetical protein
VAEWEKVAVMCLMEEHGAEKFTVLLAISSVLTNQQYMLTKLGFLQGEGGVLEKKPRVFCMLSNCSTTELHPQPNNLS